MKPAGGERALRSIIWWLTALAMVEGLLATLSYGSGAHIAVRYFSPGFGAWWNAHEFRSMEISACALGLLVAIRTGARFTEPGRIRMRAKMVALLAAALIALPLASAIANLARLGWDASSGPIRDSITAAAGYGAGMILDKILIAGVYFLKSTGFALLAGFALYAIVAAVLMISDRPQYVPRREEALK